MNPLLIMIILVAWAVSILVSHEAGFRYGRNYDKKKDDLLDKK